METVGFIAFITLPFAALGALLLVLRGIYCLIARRIDSAVIQKSQKAKQPVVRKSNAKVRGASRETRPDTETRPGTWTEVMDFSKYDAPAYQRKLAA